ncbi:MAG: hypothetical protein KAR20_27510 [Candidatus Heimdallarchaeota archaeon]|nr:hypothetical protein [Candidatus Heimdallarchaeota archaeon]
MVKMILCPNCNKQTDPINPYCTNCGIKLSMDSDQLTGKFKDKIDSERASQTQYYVRAFLVLSIFIFVVSLIFAFSVSSKPVVDINAAYPMLSPDEDAISGYNLGDRINENTIDSVGATLSDFDYQSPDIADLDRIITEEDIKDDNESNKK